MLAHDIQLRSDARQPLWRHRGLLSDPAYVITDSQQAAGYEVVAAAESGTSNTTEADNTAADDDADECNLEQQDIGLYACGLLALLLTLAVCHKRTLQVSIHQEQRSMYCRGTLHTLSASLLLQTRRWAMAYVCAVPALDVAALLCTVRGG